MFVHVSIGVCVCYLYVCWSCVYLCNKSVFVCVSDDVFSICVYWSPCLCLSMSPLECVCAICMCVGRVYISVIRVCV